MSISFQKQVFIPHAPEKVWVALTDRRALAEWLMPNDFAPIVGHEFRFEIDPMPGCEHITRCKVLEVDPPRRLVYTWLPVFKQPRNPSPEPSTVTWTLHPAPGGTRLHLEHRGLEIYPWWQRFMLRFGWGTMMKRWIGLCAARVEQGNFSPGAFPPEKRCYKANKIPADLTK
jgi:uncharacterized protein YndB with AHSA1/START domain